MTEHEADPLALLRSRVEQWRKLAKTYFQCDLAYGDMRAEVWDRMADELDSDLTALAGQWTALQPNRDALQAENTRLRAALEQGKSLPRYQLNIRLATLEPFVMPFTVDPYDTGPFVRAKELDAVLLAALARPAPAEPTP